MRNKERILFSFLFLFVASIFLESGINYLKAEDYSDDIEYLNNALKVNPDNFGTYYALSIAYYQKGDYERTIDYSERFTGSLNLNNSEQAAQNLKMASQRLSYITGAKSSLQGGYPFYDEKEIEALTRAIQIYPLTVQIYIYLVGLSPAPETSLNKEIEYLEEAYNSNPDNFGTLFALIAAYYRIKDFDKLLQCLSKFTMLNPDCSLSHYGLAIAYYKTGDMRNALAQVYQLRQLGYDDLAEELEEMGIVSSSEIQNDNVIKEQKSENFVVWSLMN